MKKLFVLLCLSVAVPAFAHCGGVHDELVDIHDSWVRATVPQQRSTGAFMTLKAKESAKLVAATSPAARVVEVHEMRMDEQQVMRMREVDAVLLPAGEIVELKPGGYHIMLIDLVEQVKEGARVPLTLTIESENGERTLVEVEAEVKSLTQGGGHSPSGAHGAHAH